MTLEDIFFNKSSIHKTIKKPYLIAEAGVNHECDIDIAKRLITEAAEGGADAIKFQTYKASSLASKNSPAYWDTSKEPTVSQYKLFKKYDAFWKSEYEILKVECDKVGIDFLSTPFDEESAIFLNDMMEAFKISSSDITNKPFIKLIASFNKPIILSTGASNIEEIQDAINWAGNTPLALLHCILNYPTPCANANIGMILDLKSKFPLLPIGYSDHTLPKDMISLEIATLLGADILEKHFTHDKSLPGNDHYHAMDKEDLKYFLTRMHRVYELVGEETKKALSEEEPARLNARRSLVAKKTINQGSKITNTDLTYKRPAHGISPKYIDNVVGKTAKENIKEDLVLTWEMIE